jgi:hypothetical protein
MEILFCIGLRFPKEKSNLLWNYREEKIAQITSSISSLPNINSSKRNRALQIRLYRSPEKAYDFTRQNTDS